MAFAGLSGWTAARLAGDRQRSGLAPGRAAARGGRGNYRELQLGGIVRRFRQITLGGTQVQQFFLIIVHGGFLFC